MKEFAEKSAEMAKVGREQGPEQAAMLVIEALPCKGCHDVYRDEKSSDADTRGMTCQHE